MVDTELRAVAPLPRATDGQTFSARRLLRWFGVVIALLIYAVVPFVTDAFWLQLLLLSGATAIAALGLRFLIGVSGQLSLAHAFFVGVGAYGYVKLGPHLAGVGTSSSSLGLPAVLAAFCAVVLAGLCGLLFSPVAARLRGIYLGLASLSLVSVGSALLINLKGLGGVYGLQVPPLNIGTFNFAERNPTTTILGTPFGMLPRLWFLVVFVLAVTYLMLRRLERTRTGRALKTLRDSPSAAASAGIHVQTYRSLAFTVSAFCAGIAGVLLALVYQSILPDDFDLTLSIMYLAIVVIGGVRSAVGSMVAALVVTGLPLILAQYAAALPLVAEPGQTGGLDAGTASQYVFGVVMIVVLLARVTRFGGVIQRVSERMSSRAGSTDVPA